MFNNTIKVHSPVRVLPLKGEHGKKNVASAGTYIGPDDAGEPAADGAPTSFLVRHDEDGRVQSYAAERLEILGWN